MLSKYTSVYIALSILPTVHTYADDKEHTSAIINSQLISNKKILNKNETTEIKPRLEDYATYNDFLNAMYLYNKTREETIKPYLIINMPHVNNVTPEYTNIPNNSDVNNAGEDTNQLYSSSSTTKAKD